MMTMTRYLASMSVLFCAWCTAQAQPPVEDVDVEAKEALCLSNIRQLTSPAAGLLEAGEGYFSPDGQQIIFQAVPTGKKHYQIYTLALDGGSPRMVSTGRGETTCAYFHPDGKSILFASSHLDPRLEHDESPSPPQGSGGGTRKYEWHKNPHMDIFVAAPDGSGLRPLVSGPGYDAEASWSRDGLHLVFASDRSKNMEIYIARADGSEPRQLTRTKKCYNGGPFFSPDGGRVIFRADREKPDMLQLMIMNADGSGERQLTHDDDVVNWCPFWHPNGRSLIYATSQHGHWNYELYLFNVDTAATQRVTWRPRFDGLPAFSADGTKLLWTSKRSQDSSQLFIADFKLPPGL